MEEGAELAAAVVVVGSWGEGLVALEVAFVGEGVGGGAADVARGEKGVTVGEKEVAAEGSGERRRRHARGKSFGECLTL